MVNKTPFVPVFGSESAIKKGTSIAGRLYFSKSGKIYLDTDNGVRILVAEKSQTHVYEQVSPNSVWVINHNLNRYPNVTVIDDEGNEIIGDVKYISTNEITVTFSEECTGKIFLN